MKMMKKFMIEDSNKTDIVIYMFKYRKVYIPV